MGVFKVKEDSWHKPLCDSHCKWVVPYIIPRDFPGRTRDKVSRDFCSYFRGITIYLIKFFATAFVVGMITMGIPFNILSGGAVLTEVPLIDLGMLLGQFMLIILLAFVFASLVIGLFIVLGLGVRSLRRKLCKSPNSPEPSLIVTKYKSWKDKYCPAIEFE